MSSVIRNLIRDIEAEKKKVYVCTGRGMLPRIHGKMDTVLSEDLGAMPSFFANIEMKDGRMLVGQVELEEIRSSGASWRQILLIRFLRRLKKGKRTCANIIFGGGGGVITSQSCDCPFSIS